MLNEQLVRFGMGRRRQGGRKVGRSWATTLNGPLSGLRVVELAGIGPGPHAAVTLGGPRR